MSDVVLLSGGLDSTVNLALARAEGVVGLALTFDYGQRAARNEAAASRTICRVVGVRHKVVRLPWLGRIKGSALTDRSIRVPRPSVDELEDPAATRGSAAAVWVPNRNGVFVNVAAAYAEGLGCNRVVVGFNAEEAATFPDNSPAFVRAANRALRYSTRSGTKVFCYTTEMAKPEIVRTARRIGAPLELTWPCYEGGSRPCGRCESCVRFRRAVRAAGCEAWLARRRRGAAAHRPSPGQKD